MSNAEYFREQISEKMEIEETAEDPTQHIEGMYDRQISYEDAPGDVQKVIDRATDPQATHIFERSGGPMGESYILAVESSAIALEGPKGPRKIMDILDDGLEATSSMPAEFSFIGKPVGSDFIFYRLSF